MSSERPTSRRFLRNPACENCKFFAASRRLTLEDNGNGECRRKAPQTPANRVDKGYGIETSRRWPTVYNDEWCGEYENNPDLPTHEDLPPLIAARPKYWWWRDPNFKLFG